jgi:hypothetical protein
VYHQKNCGERLPIGKNPPVKKNKEDYYVDFGVLSSTSIFGSGAAVKEIYLLDLLSQV